MQITHSNLIYTMALAVKATTTLLRNANILRRVLFISECKASSRSPEAVFIEKSLEEPILVVTEKENVDVIGPPDPVSNLRPIIRKRLLHETRLQEELRAFQDQTQAWNQEFWAKHNTDFIKEKQDYIQTQLANFEEKRTLTADEMSEFYKKFLDDNWSTHVKYNLEWYRKNFTLLLMALRANFEFGRS